MNTQTDPFDVPMIFLRVGWMKRYRGINRGESISRGGTWVAEHGFGHEIFHFQPFRNAFYGFVQPPSRTERINLPRLGGSSNDNSVSGVLTVWVATYPTGGAFIVVWYRNATVYRDWQPAPSGSNRRCSDEDCGYYVTASSHDAVLLLPDERIFSIPQQGKGRFGQSNIWYADDQTLHRQLRLNVLQYVESRQLPGLSGPEGSLPHQPDPLLRQLVERIAIETATAYFTGLQYHVESVEEDNVGWDLNALLDKRALKLEVKGLSGSQIVVELTPNEYAAMRAHRDSYRVCVVTNALTEPCLDIFAYSPDSGQWESSNGTVLNIQEIVAARWSIT